MVKKLYPCRVWVLEQGNFLSHGAGPRVAEPNGSSPVVENPRGSNIGKTRIREQTHVRMCCTIPSAWPQKTRLSGWGSPLICKQLVVQLPTLDFHRSHRPRQKDKKELSNKKGDESYPRIACVGRKNTSAAVAPSERGIVIGIG
jgi:hypothetical protein